MSEVNELPVYENTDTVYIPKILKNQIVVNAGKRVDLVQVADDVVQYYEMQPGDILVDDLIGMSMLRPRWNGSDWVEEATQEEIDQSNQIQLRPKTDIEVLQEENINLKETIDLILTEIIPSLMA